MFRFDMFKRSLSALVDGAKEAPFSPEETAIHLYDTSTHLYGQAQQLRLAAERLPEGGLARQIMEDNVVTLEDYAEHAAKEAMRLIGTFDPAMIRRLRGESPVAEVLPFVRPESG